MSNQFVERAKAQMGALEELIKGLPGIRDYVDKNLRRDADHRLRQLIAGQLEEQKTRLYDLQKKLMSSGGIKWTDDVDGVVQKLQTLIDRVRSARQGYTGLFDSVRINETQLDALHRFDVALAERVAGLKETFDNLAHAVSENKEVGAVIERASSAVADLSTLFNKRDEAIVDPELLKDAPAMPDLAADILGSEPKDES